MDENGKKGQLSSSFSYFFFSFWHIDYFSLPFFIELEKYLISVAFLPLISMINVSWFLGPPSIRRQKRKKKEKKSFSLIITTYNPTKAKITVKTFPLVENAFSMFSQAAHENKKKTIRELYVRAPMTIMWREKLIASKHSYHSTALRLIRFSSLFFSTHKTLFRWQNFFAGLN